MKNLASYLAEALSFGRPAYAQEGVERVAVTDGRRNAEFVLNHNVHTVIVPVEEPCRDYLTDQEISGEIRLEPWGVALLG